MNITIPGTPTAQGRPRFSARSGFVRAYDPKKSRDYKSYAKSIAAMQMNGHKPIDGAIAVNVRVYREIPKSWSKKKTERAVNCDILPTTKPDADNYYKCVSDALKGICWLDDSQITDMTVTKRYSDNPRVEINIEATT